MPGAATAAARRNAATTGGRTRRWLAGAMLLLVTSCSGSDDAAPSSLEIQGLTVVVDAADGGATVVGNVVGDVESVTIEWGDGAADSVTTGFPGVRASHTYADDGTYSIIVVAADGTGATTNRVLTAEVSGASRATTTTTLPPTTTTVPPATTTTTTTTATTTPTTAVPPPPPPPPPPTTAPPPTTTTTTTTTLPPEPLTFDITQPTGGGTALAGTSDFPFRVNVASWWRAGNLRARAGVGPASVLETPWAEAWLYHDFAGQREQATVRYTVSWDGEITVLASAGSEAGVTITVSVFELDGSNQGTRIAREVLLDESLSSEAIQFATTLTYEDSVSSQLSFPVRSGQRYRVRFDLRCEARAAFALGATVCQFGTNEMADVGPYARWRNVTVTLE